MTLFALGDIDPFLVKDFSGFDRPNNASLVPVLSDGTTSANAVLQQGGLPWYRASVTGTLIEPEDVAALRGYYESREAVNFTDGRGDITSVRVLELKMTDETDWWTCDVTLIAESVPVAGS